MAGPVFAGTYKASGEPDSSPFTYGRFHNPTWTDFENALSDLEQAQAVVFASGMAEIASVFGIVLSPGDVLVMPSDSYYTACLLASGFFKKTAYSVVHRPVSTRFYLKISMLEFTLSIILLSWPAMAKPLQWICSMHPMKC